MRNYSWRVYTHLCMDSFQDPAPFQVTAPTQEPTPESARKSVPVSGIPVSVPVSEIPKSVPVNEIPESIPVSEIPESVPEATIAESAA